MSCPLLSFEIAIPSRRVSITGLDGTVHNDIVLRNTCTTLRSREVVVDAEPFAP